MATEGIYLPVSRLQGCVASDVSVTLELTKWVQSLRGDSESGPDEGRGPPDGVTPRSHTTTSCLYDPPCDPESPEDTDGVPLLYPLSRDKVLTTHVSSDRRGTGPPPVGLRNRHPLTPGEECPSSLRNRP